MNTIQEIKQEFFAMRNGMLADTLRKSGDPHTIIFGLLVTQVKEIALRYQASKELAESMWENISSRECRMIAPYLYPKDEMDYEKAKLWCESVETFEIADVLCLALLRDMTFAETLMKELISKDDEKQQYTGFRLGLNWLVLNTLTDVSDIKSCARQNFSKSHGQLKQLLKSIIEE